MSVKKGNTIKLPDNPTKEGYTFDGWLLNDKAFDDSAKIASDVTLKASWTKTVNGETTTTTAIKGTSKTTTKKTTTKSAAATTTTTTTTDNSLKSLSLKFNRTTISTNGATTATATITCNPTNAEGCTGATIYSSEASGQNHLINISGKNVTCSDFGSGQSALVYAKSADNKITSTGVRIYCEAKLTLNKQICTQTGPRDGCSYTSTSNIPLIYSWANSAPDNFSLSYYNNDTKVVKVNDNNGLKGKYYIRVDTAGGQYAILTYIKDY